MRRSRSKHEALSGDCSVWRNRNSVLVSELGDRVHSSSAFFNRCQRPCWRAFRALVALVFQAASVLTPCLL